VLDDYAWVLEKSAGAPTSPTNFVRVIHSNLRAMHPILNDLLSFCCRSLFLFFNTLLKSLSSLFRIHPIKRPIIIKIGNATANVTSAIGAYLKPQAEVKISPALPSRTSIAIYPTRDKTIIPKRLNPIVLNFLFIFVSSEY